mgnify:CR=1 FL=1
MHQHHIGGIARGRSESDGVGSAAASNTSEGITAVIGAVVDGQGYRSSKTTAVQIGHRAGDVGIVAACRRQRDAAEKGDPVNGLAVLIPIALGLGLLGLAAFFWSLRRGQFDDLDGAALRIFVEDEEETAP